MKQITIWKIHFLQKFGEVTIEEKQQQEIEDTVGDETVDENTENTN